MRSQSRRLAISSVAVILLAIGLEYANAEECDYKTCGALMARDGSVSWGISGGREYSADTKRACAELNACARRAKNKSAGRARPAPGADSSSLKPNPKDPAPILKPDPADKQAKVMQPASPGAVHETSANGVLDANRSKSKTTPCFAAAEILIPVDCALGGLQ
jgi:hypothetical protein